MRLEHAEQQIDHPELLCREPPTQVAHRREKLHRMQRSREQLEQARVDVTPQAQSEHLLQRDDTKKVLEHHPSGILCERPFQCLDHSVGSAIGCSTASVHVDDGPWKIDEIDKGCGPDFSTNLLHRIVEHDPGQPDLNLEPTHDPRCVRPPSLRCERHHPPGCRVSDPDRPRPRARFDSTTMREKKNNEVESR
jgi:hypothetical protein